MLANEVAFGTPMPAHGGFLALHCILYYRCVLEVTLKMTEALLAGKIIEKKPQEGVTESRSHIVAIFTRF